MFPKPCTTGNISLQFTLTIECSVLYLRDDLPGNYHDLDSRQGDCLYQSISEVRGSPFPFSSALRNCPFYIANKIDHNQGSREDCDDHHGDGFAKSRPLVRPLTTVAAILKTGGVPLITSSTVFGI